MRLWSLHPRYLDVQGLVAVWREGLLARAVIDGRTRGYRNHPQLERFRAHTTPLALIDAYLLGIYVEALARGYSFDRSKLGPAPTELTIDVTAGQLAYEWQHLLGKLAARSPDDHKRLLSETTPLCHGLFRVCAGPVESWERQRDAHGDGIVADDSVNARAPRR